MYGDIQPLVILKRGVCIYGAIQPLVTLKRGACPLKCNKGLNNPMHTPLLRVANG
jgi:hypothetical protein